MQQFQQHEQFPAVQEVCQRLIKSGHKAYLAGGCVRDLLLGVRPNDFDVVTDAPMAELESLFPGAISVGRAFGIIILPFKDFQIEVAYFRSEGEYLDGRRPSSVQAASPFEDAQRRDFTVNALFYDFESGQILDFVGGRKDLSQRILRTVGSARKRFAEDKLRILRAIRMVAQLGFNIDQDTFRAVRELVTTVPVVSQERITSELRKMLLLDHRATALHYMVVSGMSEVLLPELKYLYSSQQQWARSGRLLAQILGSEKRLGFLWASLVWPEAMACRPDPDSNASSSLWLGTEFSGLFRRLGLSNDEIREAQFILSHAHRLLEFGSHRTRSSRLSPTDVELLILLDQPQGLSMLDFSLAARYVMQGEQDGLLSLHREYMRQMNREGQLPGPWIRGDDLSQLGMSSGPEMGQLLKTLYHLQLAGEFNSKERALEFARAQVLKMESMPNEDRGKNS